MSEVLQEISAEAKRLLNAERTDIQRTMYRAAAVDMDGAEINIEQSKHVSPEEMELVRAGGAAALATTEWFNDVEWLQQPRKERMDWQDLQLDATYPLDYFDERPIVGSFIENESGRHWQDQYGSIDGFGNDGKINIYIPRFVSPGSHTITTLRYPEDPTAMEAYNARYRLYMDDLDAADASICYYRAWDRVFSRDRTKTPLVIGGLSLAGIGINEVLHPGAPTTEEVLNGTRVVLHYESNPDGYVGRDVTIIGEEAITEPYWDGEHDRQPASQDLLETVLELIKKEKAS